MTTSVASELITDGGIDVRELPNDLDVIELVRHASENSDHGLAWAFYLDSTDIRAPRFTIGLRGPHGFVSWSDGRSSVHAAGGTNTEHTDYWNGGHHTQTDPHTEVPVEYVYAALGEFLATHQRPTCITWR